MSDLEIPEFLRRKTNNQEDKMSQHKEEHVETNSQTPTFEEIADAIRKLTAEIGDKERVRSGLRAKLRKMTGEL